MNIGTKIYVSDFITPLQRYSAIVEGYYFTRIERLDFTNTQAAAAEINAWCNEVTKNRIPKLVNAGDVQDAVMLIVNAIYFNGYWRRPFPQNETFRSSFYVTPAQQVTTEFMSQKEYFFFLDSKQLDAKLLRLPYKVFNQINI